jgi:hypothetical protein
LENSEYTFGIAGEMFVPPL